MYEIGTYKGNTTMMLLNYFLNQGIKNFHLHTIDIMPLFNAAIFSPLTKDRLKRNKDKILFEIGDSHEKRLVLKYDLAIVDGGHTPDGVWKDFLTVQDHAKFILFDDLHLERIFEDAYSKIIKEKRVKEIFRVYTNDKNNHHCIGLIEIGI